MANRVEGSAEIAKALGVIAADLDTVTDDLNAEFADLAAAAIRGAANQPQRSLAAAVIRAAPGDDGAVFGSVNDAVLGPSDGHHVTFGDVFYGAEYGSERPQFPPPTSGGYFATPAIEGLETDYTDRLYDAIAELIVAAERKTGVVTR